MGEFSERWLSRLRRAVSGLNWLFVILGVVSTVASPPVTFADATAAVLALTYVVLIQVVPLEWLRRPAAREFVVLASTATSAAAAALSGGFASPFVLLAMTPIVIAAVVGGYRLGVATGLLSVAMTATAEMLSANPDWIRASIWIGLALIIAITFGLARKLILEAVQQADVIAALSAETGAQLERLQSANSLISRFEDLTESTELDPETIGTALLESVRTAVPFIHGRVRTADGLAVAELGEPSPNGESWSRPIVHRGTTFGRIELAVERPVTTRQRDIVEDVLAPVGVAFANIHSVQRIARAAIENERARVARELHDGIGPALASLGLALDVARMQSGDLPGLAGELADMRTTVTTLVEDVRSSVEDLRTPEPEPLSVALVGVDTGSIGLSVDLDTKAVPRARLAGDVNAIVVEAVRNAVRHSNATTIGVFGVLDYDSGTVTIADDGRGFDPGSVPPGHFGLIGMRERAERIGAEIRLESSPDGTQITLTWPMSTT